VKDLSKSASNYVRIISVFLRSKYHTKLFDDVNFNGGLAKADCAKLIVGDDRVMSRSQSHVPPE